MAFTIEEITLGDLEILEREGVALTDLASVVDLDPTTGQMPSARVLLALAWLLNRGTRPDATFDDYRSMSLDQLMATVQEIDTAAPGVAELD